MVSTSVSSPAAFSNGRNWNAITRLLPLWAVKSVTTKTRMGESRGSMTASSVRSPPIDEIREHAEQRDLDEADHQDQGLLGQVPLPDIVAQGADGRREEDERKGHEDLQRVEEQ